MEAQLYMFPHLINDLGSLLFNKVDILILTLFILLPLQLVLDLLHGVSRQISEFLLGQILNVFVIKSYLTEIYIIFTLNEEFKVKFGHNYIFVIYGSVKLFE